MSHLTLALLGSPEVRRDGALVAWPTRKALALLIYLVVEGGVQRREALAALFWPESDSEKARATLRRTLSFLRDQIGSAWLIAEQDWVGFNFAGSYELDVQWLRSAKQTTQLEHLQRAADLVRGDFLTAFSLPDAPEFDNWASQQRETLHQAASRLFARLVEEQTQQGLRADAIVSATRWLTRDGVNETVYQRLIELHLAADDRAAAQRVYDQCRAMLASEFGATPSPAVEALIAQARNDKETRRGGDKEKGRDTLSLSPPLLVLPFVGRTHEHTQLVKAFYAVRQGKAHMVAVVGEAGIGKTRLVSEFMQWAQVQGGDLLQGRAFETGGRLPFQPLVDALRPRLEAENAPDDLLADLWLAELSTLLPELRERYADLPASTAATTAAPLRLFESVTRLLHSLAQQAPVLLWLDDVQWADEATLDLLHHLLRRAQELTTPLLLLLTLRVETLETTPALQHWLTDLQRIAPNTRLDLAPLSTHAFEHLLLSLAADHIRPAPIQRWLWRETQGHPFYLSETIKSLIEEQKVAVIHNATGAWTVDWQMITTDDLGEQLPQRVTTALRDRFARLQPPVATLVMAGAVLGHHFTFEQMQSVAGLTEAEALTALETTLALRWLSEATGGNTEGIYSFGHDKLRQVAYQAISTARRRVFHRRALTLLAAHAAPAELARHAFAAHDHAAAFHHSIAAGDAAMRLFAVRDAIGYYEQASGLMNGEWRLGDSTLNLHSPFSNLFVQLGRAYELCNERGKAQGAYERLLAIGRSTPSAALECTALTRLATLAASDLSDLARAERLLHEARSVAERTQDMVNLVDIEWNLAQMGIYRTDPPAARQHGQRALTLARQLDQPALVARSLNQLAFAESAWGDLPATERYVQEALSLFVALSDRAMEVDSLCLLADAVTRQGRATEGVDLARRAQALSQQIENLWGVSNSAVRLALALLESNAYDEARATAQAGMEIARSHQMMPMLILNLTILGMAQRALHQIPAAIATHQEAYSLSELIHYTYFQTMSASELCADFAAQDDWANAYQWANRACQLRHPEVLAFPGFERHVEIGALLCYGESGLAQAEVARIGALVGDNPRYQRVYQACVAVLAEIAP